MDDEPLVRAGQRAIMESEPNIEVIGEAADGAAVVPLVRQLRPDVIAMDVRMPLLNGIEATRAVLGTLVNPPKILVIITFENDEPVYQALRVAANGFLLKRARPADRSSGATGDGRDSLLFPSALCRLAAEYGNRSARQRVDRAVLAEREAIILRLMARGLSNADIAAHLIISTETVQSHLSSVLGKRSVRDRTQAVIAAYDSGFVTPADD